jgi:hypothetical protein
LDKLPSFLVGAASSRSTSSLGPCLDPTPTPRNPYEPPSSTVGGSEPEAVVTPKRDAALYWRVAFLAAFAVLSVRLGWGDWTNWGYLLIAVFCAASAILLWILSPLSRYPLYAVTFYLIGGALFRGISNYVHNPALLNDPLERQIIFWLIPGLTAALLVSCCMYARRITRSA